MTRQPLDPEARQALTRLAAREQEARVVALAAAQTFRAAVREAVAAGATYRDIAAATGRSFQRIAQIAKAGR